MAQKQTKPLDRVSLRYHDSAHPDRITAFIQIDSFPTAPVRIATLAMTPAEAVELAGRLIDAATRQGYHLSAQKETR